MAKRKELKKKVNYISSELFMECLVNKLYVPGTDKDKADQLMSEVLNMQNDFLSRISPVMPKAIIKNSRQTLTPKFKKSLTPWANWCKRKNGKCFLQLYLPPPVGMEIGGDSALL